MNQSETLFYVTETLWKANKKENTDILIRMSRKITNTIFEKAWRTWKLADG